jgi:hypothetical protein
MKQKKPQSESFPASQLDQNYFSATEETGLGKYIRRGFYITGGTIVGLLIDHGSLEMTIVAGKKIHSETHFIPHVIQRQVKILAGKFIRSLKPKSNGAKK